MAGRMKASVLPEPVRAIPTRSNPESSTGQACARQEEPALRVTGASETC